MHPKSPFSVRKDENLIVMLLLTILVGSFLYQWATRSNLAALLAFDSSLVGQQPWRILSYIFVPMRGVLGIVFGGMWIWSLGGLAEREMNSQRFGIALLAFTLLSGLSLWVGSLVTGLPGILAGLWGLIACITVLWGTRYPEQSVLFMFVIPLKAKWIALISAALFVFGTHPVLAPFAALPLLLAYLLAKDKLPIPYLPIRAVRARAKTRSGMSTSSEFMADVRKREKEREEKERLRKLFESGMIENDTKDQ